MSYLLLFIEKAVNVRILFYMVYTWKKAVCW